MTYPLSDLVPGPRRGGSPTPATRPPRPLPLVLAALVPSLLAGCAGDLENPERFTGGIGDLDGGTNADASTGDGCPPDLDLDALFEDRCGTSVCHEGDGAGGGVDLISDGVAARLVDVPATGKDDCVPSSVLVDSSDLDASYMLEKLTSSRPECGDPMPLLQAQLTAGEVACVREWAAALVEESR